MKISIYKKDKHFVKYKYAYDIYLEGKKLPCFMADEEGGVIETYIEDADGSILYVDNEIITKHLYGKVKIVFKWWLIPYNEVINFYYRWFKFRVYYTDNGKSNTIYRNGIINYILIGRRY